MTTRSRRTLAFCTGVALAAAGCSGDGASSGFTLRDSAGVTIAENVAPLWRDDLGWRLSPQPVLEIGVFEGAPEYQLYRAIDVRRLSDGRIVVANAGTHELRFYDQAGLYLGASGREGGGPGEFENLGNLNLLAGDSLLVWDWGNNRASVFDGAGNFARSFKLRTGSDEDAAFPWPRGVFSDRTMLAQTGGVFTPESRTGVSRDSVPYVRYDLAGERVDSVGRFAGAEYYVQRVGEGGILVRSRPLGRSPRLAVHGAGFYFGTSDTYEVGYYSNDGTLLRLVRKAQDNLPVTAEDIETYKRERLENASGERYRERLAEMFKQVPFPETMPAYSSMLVDVEGNLWIADYGRPGDEQLRWSVFDRQGRWLGVVELPDRFSPDQIGDDFVLGRYRDDLDVEYVRLYELVKGPGEP